MSAHDGRESTADSSEFIKELFKKSSRYELIDLVGQGGMGQVYKAIDRELDEVVALKLLKPKLSSDPNLITRFKQEIKLTRRIKHKNVGRIFDLGEIGGFKFISMEYVDGMSLKDLILSRGQFSLPLALHVFRQVLAGLAAAHEENIVHRDIKPQNIMVSRDYTVYVLDFGIARSLESEDLFQIGVLVGSPAYMSTEQVLRKEIDHRSDVYSLGVLLYELLTARPPFQARSLVVAANKHVTERPPDVRDTRPDVPEWVAKMILRCMEKDPALRYQTVVEMLKEIEAQDAEAEAAGEPTPAQAAAGATLVTPPPTVMPAAALAQEDDAPTIQHVPPAVSDTLPIAEGATPEVAPVKERPAALVAEDDPEIIDALKGKLEALKLDVEFVSDGVTAVDRAVHGHFDLILISSDLPRLDGVEATRILKNYASTREVPVLLLIPAGNSETENLAFDSGVADVVSKPINMPAFTRKTRSLLQL